MILNALSRSFSQVVVTRPGRFKVGLIEDQMDIVATFCVVCEARWATDPGVLNAFTCDSLSFVFLPMHCSLQFWSFFTFIFNLSLVFQRVQELARVTTKKTRQDFGFITCFDPYLPESRHSKKNGLLVVDVLLLRGYLAVIPLVGVNAVHKLPSKPFPVRPRVLSLGKRNLD